MGITCTSLGKHKLFEIFWINLTFGFLIIDILLYLKYWWRLHFKRNFYFRWCFFSFNSFVNSQYLLWKIVKWVSVWRLKMNFFFLTIFINYIQGAGTTWAYLLFFNHHCLQFLSLCLPISHFLFKLSNIFNRVQLMLILTFLLMKFCIYSFSESNHFTLVWYILNWICTLWFIITGVNCWLLHSCKLFWSLFTFFQIWCAKTLIDVFNCLFIIIFNYHRLLKLCFCIFLN